jgi:hypothetical protein
MKFGSFVSSKSDTKVIVRVPRVPHASANMSLSVVPTPRALFAPKCSPLDFCPQTTDIKPKSTTAKVIPTFLNMNNKEGKSTANSLAKLMIKIESKHVRIKSNESLKTEEKQKLTPGSISQLNRDIKSILAPQTQSRAVNH